MRVSAFTKDQFKKKKKTVRLILRQDFHLTKKNVFFDKEEGKQ